VSENFSVAAGERTWRAPLPYRFTLLTAHTALVAAAAAFGWVTLSSNQLPGAVVLAVWAPLWALLAFRAWTVSATLTADTLVIRNMMSTERLLVADISRVTLQSPRRVLKVTEGRPAPPSAAPARHRDPGERYTVSAVQVGVLAALAGVRCSGDDAADHIAAAAGLPPLPPRPARVSREMSRLMIPAGLVLSALGFALTAAGPLGPVPLSGTLQGFGATLIALAALAELGRFLYHRHGSA
jgi:hypothetical protein